MSRGIVSIFLERSAVRRDRAAPLLAQPLWSPCKSRCCSSWLVPYCIKSPPTPTQGRPWYFPSRLQPSRHAFCDLQIVVRCRLAVVALHAVILCIFRQVDGHLYISACLPLQLYRSESTCADSTSMTIFQALLTTVWVWRPDFAQYL
jgi:hypothetical protein